MPFERNSDFCLGAEQLENALIFAATEFENSSTKCDENATSDAFQLKVFRTNVVKGRKDLELLQDEENEHSNAVPVIFNKLVNNVLQIKHRQNSFECFNKKNARNVPISSCTVSYDRISSLTFYTIRNNEKVQVDVTIRKFVGQPRYADKESESCEEYCIKIFIHKKLAEPEKFKQEFSQFLSTGKHFIDFIIETIWPCIDHAVQEKVQKMEKSISLQRVDRSADDQRKLNQRSAPREQQQRFFIRGDQHRDSQRDDHNRDNKRDNQNRDNNRQFNRENHLREHDNQENRRENYHRGNQHHQGNRNPPLGEWSRIDARDQKQFDPTRSSRGGHHDRFSGNRNFKPFTGESNKNWRPV